ncbi:MAG: DUF1553 domain-containing protein [Planctomycetota bacterium]
MASLVLALLLSAAPLPQQDPQWADAPLRASGRTVDELLRDAMLAQGVSPAAEADRVTLVRRMHLDLWGLPPSPEEVANAHPEDPRWYEATVDSMLASPRHAEHLARQWLDVVRYADTDGFETNTPRPNAYPYRDWVIDAFHGDMPFDRFVLAQLAGDTIGMDAATGFLVAGPTDTVKSPDPRLTAEQRANEIADMVGTTGAAFLGATVGCARCHDHKFDPITQRDFYGLAAVFAGVRHGERPLRDANHDASRVARRAAIEAELTALASRADAPVDATLSIDTFAPRIARSVRMTITATNDGAQPCIDELEVFGPDDPSFDLARASTGASASASSLLPGYAIHRVEHLNDGRYGNAHSWISNESGAGWLRIDLPRPARVDRVVWARDREARYADRLATSYRIEVAGDDGVFVTVADAALRAKQVGGDDSAHRRALAAELAQLTAAPAGYVGSFTDPEPTHLLKRGDPMQPLDAVAPGAIASIGAMTVADAAAESTRRAALAYWLCGPARVRTARVMANRLWLWHFGQGLVTTPSDFGRNGAAPLVPALLDELACTLIDGGWSIRAVEKAIVMSDAYRRSSAVRDELAESRDAQSRLLWRYPARRAHAEVIRDGILAVSGALDLRMGGPGFDFFEPNDNYVRVYEPKRSFGPNEFRRMVYAKVVRMERDATFGSFDCPDAGQPMPQRVRSTTPLQALALLNSPFVLQQAELFAERVRREAGDAPAAQVARAFELALQRGPDAEESMSSVALVRVHGLAALCRALFNTSEFLFVP